MEEQVSKSTVSGPSDPKDYFFLLLIDFVFLRIALTVSVLK